MTLSTRITAWTLPAALLLFAGLTGCNQAGDSPEVATSETSDQHEAHEHADDGHNHLGWWCSEHGVPEKECSQCSTAAAAEFKENGDWCEEHNRADSQCFICHPEQIEVYAAEYRAKYGEDPPAIAPEETE